MFRFTSPYSQYDLTVPGFGSVKFENGLFITENEGLADAMRQGKYFGVNYFEVKERPRGRGKANNEE